MPEARGPVLSRVKGSSLTTKDLSLSMPVSRMRFRLHILGFPISRIAPAAWLGEGEFCGYLPRENLQDAAVPRVVLHPERVVATSGLWETLGEPAARGRGTWVHVG